MNCNKADTDQPKCKGRYVAQETNAGGEADAAFYAATPPLEAKRVLFSRWAKERCMCTAVGTERLQLHVLDLKAT